jgi:adenylate cyclase
MHIAGVLHQLRGEPALAQERSEMVIALADEHGLELWSAFGSINRGWARVEQGDVEEGINELQRGLTAYEATGAKLWRPYSLGLLAQALSRAGRNEDGLTMVTEALSIVQRSGEDWARAELLRIKGELLIVRAKIGDGPSSTSVAQAEEVLNEALALAARQAAKSWELRVVTSLGRLYERVGRRADARRVIDRSYGWFNEGFETRDLKAAKSILEQLAPGRTKSATTRT